MARPLIDLTGKRFGSWTVLFRHSENCPSYPHGPMWVCRCDCGGVYIVHGHNLRYGHSTCCHNCRDEKRNDGRDAYYRAKAMEKGAANVYP